MHNLSTMVLLLLLTCCNGFSNRDLVNYSLPLDGLLDSLNFEPGILYLHVDKSDFILSVMADTMIVKQYPVVLGGNPVDDKLRQGSWSKQNIHTGAGISLSGSTIQMKSHGKNTGRRNRRASSKNMTRLVARLVFMEFQQELMRSLTSG